MDGETAKSEGFCGFFGLLWTYVGGQMAEGRPPALKHSEQF